jgi:hypothetical protein
MNAGRLAAVGVPDYSRIVTGSCRRVASGLAALLSAGLLAALPVGARASCASPANAIEAENCLTGTPQSAWDVVGAGDPSIQGYATNISVNRGETVYFKVKTDARVYRLDIYRMGYYQGNGARLVATVNPSASLPQTQPACLANSTTGLLDCGNWGVSASWTVPAGAVSGIYFALLTRLDTGGQSHVLFIVRDDASRSAILFQASDTTWQAYNDYGGNNFYVGNTAAARAYKLSYNRPFNTREYQSASWVFNAEYPMVRWLEANGYDVSYFTDTDSDRDGSLIENHALWMSNGHDEYWSGGQRVSVEAARAAGVHLAFFSANKIFWKTRWENSIDGSSAPYRTLVCYKETLSGAIDPADPPIWTGTWRDSRFSPPADGGRPENALAGTLFQINGPYETAIKVAQSDGHLRFWRNTSIASLAAGQTATLAPGTLGLEVDVDMDNGFQPAGLFGLSTTPISVTNQYLLDQGAIYGAGSVTHKLTLYRHSSGALVFSSGTYQWAWGLDANHDGDQNITDVRMQQATVNLLADMGVQPATMQPGLVPASASTDFAPPTSTINSPLPGASLVAGSTMTITGTAYDTGGGVVGAVEVSTDGGATWHPATGRENWSYTWTPTTTGPATIRSRAVDDSGNLESPSGGVGAAVTWGPNCPSGCFTIWPSAATPLMVESGDGGAVEVGVKFRSSMNGSVTGIRFYKSSLNTGTHVGSLWTSTGTRLASATFTGEGRSGWQQVNFSQPVPVTANTIYVASYHTSAGHFSSDQGYFFGTGVESPPLQALADGASGGNGVYAYSSTSAFPNSSFGSTNYWVDVVFSPPPLSSIAVTPASSTVGTGTSQQFTATGSYSDGSTQDLAGQVTWTSSNANAATISGGGLTTALSAGTTTISATLGGVSGSATLAVQFVPLAIATTSLPAGTQNVPYAATLAAVGGTPPYSWSLSAGALPNGLGLSAGGAISGTPTAIGTFTLTVVATDAASRTAAQSFSIAILSQTGLTIWPGTTPGNVDHGPDNAVEVGVKLRADRGGYITGIRFYKASGNTGVHVGNLWTSAGTLLASATFTGETASGWQQVSFPYPVPITANTIYVASYHTNVGHYSQDLNYFASAGVDNPPLHALASGVSPDGVYAYGPNSNFPAGTYASANYWVDVVFTPASLSSIAVTPANPTVGTGSMQQFAATGTYADGSTQDLTGQVTWGSSNASVATINGAGLATALDAGMTTITATLGGVSGNTTLTAQFVPLAVATTSLPAGTQNVPYTATLSAVGGTTPYTWSIFAGALPAGLGLAAGGVISGTPTVSGTFTFAVLVTDAASRTATELLSLDILPEAGRTIWPSTAIPGNVDHGADGPVELGVKFFADQNGYVTGIRFYKASTNTGTHVGSLWTSTGTLLASATFTGETASGWQQVDFPHPVPITANTVYVASYHTDVGHYSQDVFYFGSTGVDNPPLHALANSASGGNGVYAYGSTSSFPGGSYIATNYWVDVVFTAGP